MELVASRINAEKTAASEPPQVVAKVPQSADGKVRIEDIVKAVVESGKTLPAHCTLSYARADSNTFYYCGQLPLQEGSRLLHYEKIKDGLVLRLRETPEVSSSQKRLSAEKPVRNEEKKEKKKKKKNHFGGRQNEKRVRVAIDAYKRWRALYEAKSVSKEKLSLDDAAKQVGENKKTLYDYKKQFSLGLKYGYNFDANGDKRMGHLRAFIKNWERELFIKEAEVHKRPVPKLVPLTVLHHVE